MPLFPSVILFVRIFSCLTTERGVWCGCCWCSKDRPYDGYRYGHDDAATSGLLLPPACLGFRDWRDTSALFSTPPTHPSCCCSAGGRCADGSTRPIFVFRLSDAMFCLCLCQQDWSACDVITPTIRCVSRQQQRRAGSFPSLAPPPAHLLWLDWYPPRFIVRRANSFRSGKEGGHQQLSRAIFSYFLEQNLSPRGIF